MQPHECTYRAHARGYHRLQPQRNADGGGYLHLGARARGHDAELAARTCGKCRTRRSPSLRSGTLPYRHRAWAAPHAALRRTRGGELRRRGTDRTYACARRQERVAAGGEHRDQRGTPDARRSARNERAVAALRQLKQVRTRHHRRPRRSAHGGKACTERPASARTLPRPPHRRNEASRQRDGQGAAHRRRALRSHGDGQGTRDPSAAVTRRHRRHGGRPDRRPSRPAHSGHRHRLPVHPRKATRRNSGGGNGDGSAACRAAEGAGRHGGRRGGGRAAHPARGRCLL